MTCDFLLHSDFSSLIRNKICVELGAGTGIVGILASMMGGKVTLTDQESMLELMQENIKLNGLEEKKGEEEGKQSSGGDSSSSGGGCFAKVLNWGEACAPEFLNPPVDIIFASDCVYHEVIFEPLIKTLCELSSVSPLTTVTYLGFKKRWRSSKRFFAMAKKKFNLEKVVWNSPNYEKFNRDSMTIYKMTLKQKKQQQTQSQQSKK